MHRCAKVALGIGAAGLAVRVAAAVAGIPPTDGDEATTGIVARHIAEGIDYPLYFYGQWYMGAIEAYLAAPLFMVFDSSTWLLRVPNFGWYLLLLWSMYMLSAKLFNRRLAVVVVALLATGADRALLNQLRAGGGYPELVPMTATLALLTVVLAQDRGLSVPKRFAGFTAWGVLAGLIVWDDLLALPYLGVAAGLLVLFSWKRIVSLTMACVGALIGAAPVIYVNRTGQVDSWEELKLLRNSGAAEADVPTYTLAEHLNGGILHSVPMATGLCAPDNCTSAQTWWGPTFVVLLLAGGWWTALMLFRRLRPGTPRTHLVRLFARAALAVAAGFTLLQYVRSPGAVATPYANARYLSMLLPVLPLVLWPLWGLARGVRQQPYPRWLGTGVRAGAAAIMAAVLALGVYATVAAFAIMGPDARKAEREYRALAAELRRQGIVEFYADYWICYRLTFLVREEITCATISPDLGTGFDRYEPYRERMRYATRPAYVTLLDSPTETALVARLQRGGRYVPPTVVADRFHVYWPAERPAIPKP